MSPDFAAMLKAFKQEDDILTRRVIMERSAVTDLNTFESFRMAGLVAQCEWRGAVHPREYVLSPLGKDRREMALGL
jgi:hypothetical protein